MVKIAKQGFVWHELMTTDVRGAKKFYEEVTGLTTTPGDYQMMMSGDKPVGGLVGPRKEGPGWPSGGPEPHWIPYIGVPDAAAAAKKAAELGGKVLLPPTAIPGMGTAAVLRDPQGAAFGVFTTVPG